jgi:hypothetical protein
MQPHPIVMSEINRQRVDVIFDLLGKAIGKTGEATHAHAHGQIVPLNK